MHLDSPAPQGLPSHLDLNFDMSPASSASFPVTPQESSPITPSDLLLPSEYDSHYMAPYHSFPENTLTKSSNDLTLPALSMLPQSRTSRTSPNNSPAYVSSTFFESNNERQLSQAPSRNFFYEPRHSSQQWPRRQAFPNNLQSSDRRPHNNQSLFESPSAIRGHHHQIMGEPSIIRSHPTTPVEPYSMTSNEVLSG